MDLIEKAYLAGLIDGEGCITILKSSKKNKRKDKVWVSYRPVIVISNTSLRLLEHAQDIIGLGEIYDRVHYDPNCKLQHGLHIYRKADVSQLCKQLVPFLFEKKAQAEIIVTACSENNLAKYYPIIHELNRKGNKRRINK